MIFRSVCSGIEAASVAWSPLGWKADAFAEIEPFPSAVLAHHYPEVPNLGDITRFREWGDAAFDVLVGGTPCQSFSVAGLRKGLADPRGNLALIYLGILDRFRPAWMVWENVPGVLSSNGGKDFGAFLGGLGELGYGFAYRVLDAQFFGLAQRRKRVFVVGYLGDWRRAAAVLFERESLSGNPPPSRKAGKEVAPTLISARTKGGGGLGTDFDCDGGLIPQGVALRGREGGATAELTGDVMTAPRTGGGGGDKPHVLMPMAFGGNNKSGPIDVATAQTAHGGTGRLDFESETFIATRAIAATLTRGAESSGKGGYAGRRQEDDDNLVAHALRADGFDASEDGTGRGTPLTVDDWRVRRLTPAECERLQGFPDSYTAIPYRGKIAADGPRYKALGNSMATNVMRWIGERIDAVESMRAAA